MEIKEEKSPSIQQIDPGRRHRRPRPPRRPRRPRRRRRRHVEKLIVTSYSTAGCQREFLTIVVMTTSNASRLPNLSPVLHKAITSTKKQI